METVFRISLIQIAGFLVGFVCWAVNHPYYKILFLFLPHFVAGVMGLKMRKRFKGQFKLVKKMKILADS